MSFKIFIANTFGLIKPTAKIEAAHEALLHDYHQFCDFEQSSLLKEYQDLEMIVNSATFKQNKKELQQLSLKGSKEEAQLKDLKKLEQNGKLRKYYSTLKSEGLKRFNELKKQNDSADNKFLAQFEKSSSYKNYLQMKDSAERKRLEELQELTSSAEFKTRVTYLEDKQKWEKTEDAVQERRFAELQKMPDQINYLKYKNSNAFDFFKKWELVFEDRFDSQKLDPQKWITKSHWANQTLGQNFSQVGDIHAFTDGKNIVTDGKSLKIEVRKEKAAGMQWRIPFGFVPQDFEYTSGIISTVANEWWNHGILEAKVKYSPSADLVDAIYLLGEETSPQINLVEMGAKNRLGTLSKSNGKIHADCESISGLKTGEFYIFRLEWTSNALIWKINGREMLKIDLHIPSHALHLNAASIVVNEPNGSLPHRFEIDWVRFYRHHKA